MFINSEKIRKKIIMHKFLKEWKYICSLNYAEVLKENKKSNIQVLERKTQDWQGYNPKISDALSYGLITTECNFLKRDIENKLRQVLIRTIDLDYFKNCMRCYKINDIKFFSSTDYNNMINNDIDKLKKAINEVDNLKEEYFGCVITNNTTEDIYEGSKSINMLDIPQANPDDIVVRIYAWDIFYSYEFLIISKDKISDVFFWTSD